MKLFVVSISREYGSGGRMIGRQLAQQLGIDFYDKEIITLHHIGGAGKRTSAGHCTGMVGKKDK